MHNPPHSTLLLIVINYLGEYGSLCVADKRKLFSNGSGGTNNGSGSNKSKKNDGCRRSNTQTNISCDSYARS